VRVFIADGDRAFVSSLKRDLSGAGHIVDVAFSGENALWHALEFEYEAVILNVRLPGMNGVQVARTVREGKPSTPILMLVEATELSHHKSVLLAVGDGYVIKPFEFTALIGHLAVVTRSDAYQRPRLLRVGDLRMNLATRQAWRADIELNLSPREFALLRLFLTCPEQVLSRREILERVWARDHDKAANLVDQYVLYLRRKIDRPFGLRQLETVRGLGYRLRDCPRRSAHPPSSRSATAQPART
jgi:two-component system OmpR family response regulator